MDWNVRAVKFTPRRTHALLSKVRAYVAMLCRLTLKLNARDSYFFSRLVWLATHCQRPSVYTQVSVKRPKWS